MTVADNTLAFTTPQQAGTYYVVYTVKDKAGLSDTATLTVNVDDNATIEPPTAYDYRVPSSATIDKKSIDVDVSQWIANPSGSADELQVAVDDSATGHAHIKGGDKSTTISVELTDEARAVPYTVTNTTYNITSTAFIQVPAYGVFPPTLRPSAGIEGERTRDDHHQYRRLCARGRRQDRVCGRRRFGERHEGRGRRPVCERPDVEVHRIKGLFRSSVHHLHRGGWQNATRNDNVKIINSAVLTLPITVIGRDMPAPTFSSSTIDVVAGESATTIDLTALTHSRPTCTTMRSSTRIRVAPIPTR